MVAISSQWGRQLAGVVASAPLCADFLVPMLLLACSSPGWAPFARASTLCGIVAELTSSRCSRHQKQSLRRVPRCRCQAQRSRTCVSWPHVGGCHRCCGARS